MALVRALDSGRELPVDGGEIGTGDDGDADAQSEQRLQLRLERAYMLCRAAPTVLSQSTAMTQNGRVSS